MKSKNLIKNEDPQSAERKFDCLRRLVGVSTPNRLPPNVRNLAAERGAQTFIPGLTDRRKS